MGRGSRNNSTLTRPTQMRTRGSRAASTRPDTPGDRFEKLVERSGAQLGQIEARVASAACRVGSQLENRIALFKRDNPDFNNGISGKIAVAKSKYADFVERVKSKLTSRESKEDFAAVAGFTGALVVAGESPAGILIGGTAFFAASKALRSYYRRRDAKKNS